MCKSKRQRIKAEAYKEFAERVKEKTIIVGKIGNLPFECISPTDVDNLLKELVGEGNDEM